jgi:pimeloyl-ACP methyl ester carboxylesterase
MTNQRGGREAPIAGDGGIPATRADCVLLVHGFLAHRMMLAVLAHRLRLHGHRTEPWGYRNMRCSLMVHAEQFAEKLRQLDADPTVGRVHLVTHSMGCIIGRAALAIFRPGKIGRFVMLAPPNRGSFVARATAGTLGRVFRPVIELSTAEDSLVNSLPTPQGVELGVIAAGRDALIAPESTRPDVPHDHVTVPCLHSSLLYRRDAAELVAAFLRDGHFPGPVSPASTSSSEGAMR